MSRNQYVNLTRARFNRFSASGKAVGFFVLNDRDREEEYWCPLSAYRLEPNDPFVGVSRWWADQKKLKYTEPFKSNI